MNGYAEYIGHQEDFDGPAIALFNICIPGNILDGSTVEVTTINKLCLTDLRDRNGKKLLNVPLPKAEVRS